MKPVMSFLIYFFIHIIAIRFWMNLTSKVNIFDRLIYCYNFILKFIRKIRTGEKFSH